MFNFNQKIKLENKKVGHDNPIFIIAEAGVNHNGDLGLAKELVIQAKKAGADCVKFQTFKADNLVTEGAPKATYQLKVTNPKESQKAMLKKLELNLDDYYVLKKLCDDVGIIFMSTPYNFSDVDVLDKLGVSSFKLASMHLTEIPIIEYVAKKNKPVFMSVGMSSIKDVITAVKTFQAIGNKNLILLQCTTNYPTKINQVNLKAISTIQAAAGTIVGYSDHTEGIEAPILAVAVGAKVIEKHFTLDKKLPGPDHSSSSDPKEFSEMVKLIREAEVIMGSSKREPTSDEKFNMLGMKRSLATTCAIKKGEQITKKMIDFMRPASGLSPNLYYNVIGKTAKRDIKKGVVLVVKDIIF